VLCLSESIDDLVSVCHTCVVGAAAADAVQQERMGDTKDEFYLRYYTGHEGKFGHEFLEFEFRYAGSWVCACSHARALPVERDGACQSSRATADGCAACPDGGNHAGPTESCGMRTTPTTRATT